MWTDIQLLSCDESIDILVNVDETVKHQLNKRVVFFVLKVYKYKTNTFFN
jgi:hypothetical protein